jgi:hypothetical protein
LKAKCMMNNGLDNLKGIPIVLNMDIGACGIQKSHVRELRLIFMWSGPICFDLARAIPLARAPSARFI